MKKHIKKVRFRKIKMQNYTCLFYNKYTILIKVFAKTFGVSKIIINFKFLKNEKNRNFSDGKSEWGDTRT